MIDHQNTMQESEIYSLFLPNEIILSGNLFCSDVYKIFKNTQFFLYTILTKNIKKTEHVS